MTNNQKLSAFILALLMSGLAPLGAAPTKEQQQCARESNKTFNAAVKACRKKPKGEQKACTTQARKARAAALKSCKAPKKEPAPDMDDN